MAFFSSMLVGSFPVTGSLMHPNPKTETFSFVFPKSLYNSYIPPLKKNKFDKFKLILKCPAWVSRHFQDLFINDH